MFVIDSQKVFFGIMLILAFMLLWVRSKHAGRESFNIFRLHGSWHIGSHSILLPSILALSLEESRTGILSYEVQPEIVIYISWSCIESTVSVLPLR